MIGHWSGTYYQYNVHLAYPMVLGTKSAPKGLAVTLIWPTLRSSRTIGTGKFKEGHVSWTEDRLMEGQDVALGGHYEAAFVDEDTLVGTYLNHAGGKGLFTLSRDRGVGPLTASR